MTDSTRQRDSGDPTADFALAQRILDVAPVLGEQHGWDGLHLYQIVQV